MTNIMPWVSHDSVERTTPVRLQQPLGRSLPVRSLNKSAAAAMASCVVPRSPTWPRTVKQQHGRALRRALAVRQMVLLQMRQRWRKCHNGSCAVSVKAMVVKVCQWKRRYPSTLRPMKILRNRMKIQSLSELIPDILCPVRLKVFSVQALACSHLLHVNLWIQSSSKIRSRRSCLSHPRHQQPRHHDLSFRQVLKVYMTWIENLCMEMVQNWIFAPDVGLHFGMWYLRWKSLSFEMHERW